MLPSESIGKHPKSVGGANEQLLKWVMPVNHSVCHPVGSCNKWTDKQNESYSVLLLAVVVKVTVNDLSIFPWFVFKINKMVTWAAL